MRGLVAQYDIVVANEVHPFASGPLFNPRFPVGSALHQILWSQKETCKVFNHQMVQVKRKAEKSASQVLLRVHSHTDYFDDRVQTHSSVCLDKWVGSSVVTVRNPLTNYVSARERGFFDGNLSEWVSRASNFVKDHEHLPRFRFESVMVDLDNGLRELGRALGLSKRPKALEESDIPFFSGDNRILEPIVGKAFLEKDAVNQQRIVQDPHYREEIIRCLSALNSFQRLLGYRETEL